MTEASYAVQRIRRELVDTHSRASNAQGKYERQKLFNVAFAYGLALKYLSEESSIQAQPGIANGYRFTGGEVEVAREWLGTDGDLLGPITC